VRLLLVGQLPLVSSRFGIVTPPEGVGLARLGLQLPFQLFGRPLLVRSVLL
jgi:hypothetical protein